MEMEIQQEQVRLKNREIDHNKVLAEKSIDAQLEDRSRTRIQATKITIYTYVFFGIVIFMLLAFGAYVISQDKEAVLSEIMGLFIELCKYGIGAVTGYFIAKAKFKSENSNNNSPE
jgi:uncharacterized membrane protein